jgi:hypothetical protein
VAPGANGGGGTPRSSYDATAWARREERDGGGGKGRDDEENGGPHSGKADKPFADVHNQLLAKGYVQARDFPFMLPGATVPLFTERRYELRPGIPVTDKLTRKTSRFFHVGGDGVPLCDTGPRRIIYGWPAIMTAGLDVPVFVTEGANKSEPLCAAGLLATAAPYHKWSDECVAALNGRHIVYLEDHDHIGPDGKRGGEKLSADARDKLAPGAADFRIVPAIHLWKNLGRSGEPPHGWDCKDWIEAGGDPARLLEICREVPTERTELDVWDAGDLLCSGDPDPRQWLTRWIFCRGFLSGVVAPGDAGKTTLRLTQGIELATFRELLGRRLFLRCRVLIICFEDDRAELHRRLKAICMHHGIDPNELKGWLFCCNIHDAKLAERVDGKLQAGPLDAMLRKAIARFQADLVILDPFVKLHSLEENNNSDMDFVCTRLIMLAQEFNIAIDSPAHTHKGTIVAGDADARRGASAQRDAGRLDYSLTSMMEEEAKLFGIDVDERKSYVQLKRAKANIVRAMKAEWFQLVNVSLGNASTLYPDGDDVQAIEPWIPPETWAGITPETLNLVLDTIAAGLPNGQRYSAENNAKGRAAWPIIQQISPEKTEAQCREIIRSWIKAGVLITASYDDPVYRRLIADMDKETA